MFACLHGSGNLAALALEFSPMVEQTEPQTVTLDASGLDRLFGLPHDVAAAMARRAGETGARVHIALASNPDAAVCAARGFAGINILPHGDEAKFLGELPLGLLSPSPELMETLERWGIRRFRDLAALPPLGIAERLGPEGLRLRELARGEADRKLRPIEEPESFEDAIELEYPVELLEPLSFLLARLLNGLCTRLATRALATDELKLRLQLENRAPHERTLRLPAPALDSKGFLKLLQLDLAAHPPAAPVVSIWLQVNPVKPRPAQGGLFLPAAPEPVKLEITLARIRAIVGEGNVGSPELLNTHRPGAFRMAGALGHSGEDRPRGGGACFSLPSIAAPAQPEGSSSKPIRSALLGGRSESATLAFRIFRPPRAARVKIDSGHPRFVAAEGIRGEVLQLAGPWRTSGDWWTPDPWSREEWDISLSDGALYRIYCSPRGWFVEGSYD